MDDSILTSTKKILGLSEEYTYFDVDILTHINSVFVILAQLGIGPPAGFVVEDKTVTWGDFLGTDPNILFNSIKTYVYLRVRILFDPPQLPHLINALEEQVREFEWRLNVQREETDWVDPTPPVPVEEPI